MTDEERRALKPGDRVLVQDKLGKLSEWTVEEQPLHVLTSIWIIFLRNSKVTRWAPLSRVVSLIESPAQIKAERDALKDTENQLRLLQQAFEKHGECPTAWSDMCDEVEKLGQSRLELQQAWAELKQSRESVAWWQQVAEAKQEERDRYRAALEMIAQVRHVSGSAQGTHRSHLRLVDAVLAGADVRDLATVEAIAAGTWKPGGE